MKSIILLLTILFLTQCKKELPTKLPSTNESANPAGFLLPAIVGRSFWFGGFPASGIKQQGYSKVLTASF